MTACSLAGLPRTSNDAAVRFERCKRRYHAMYSGFMSAEGAQGWHTQWQVYANWKAPQARKERQRRSHQPPGEGCWPGVVWAWRG